MLKLNDDVKMAVLRMLRKKLEEMVDEHAILSKKTLLRLKQDGHKTMEVEYASSTPDVDMSRNIPMLEKQIAKLKEIILKVEKTSEYGICSCGNKIPVARLMEVPFVELCVDCKTAIEKEQNRLKKYRGFIKGDGLAYI